MPCWLIGVALMPWALSLQRVRATSLEIIVPWIQKITGVEKVAVFMDEGVDEILKTCAGLGIDTIQLHAAPSTEHERLIER